MWTDIVVWKVHILNIVEAKIQEVHLDWSNLPSLGKLIYGNTANIVQTS